MRPVPFGADAQNCAGDICIAGVQKNNRRAEGALLSLFFGIRSLPIPTHLEPLHPFPRVRFELGANSKADRIGTD